MLTPPSTVLFLSANPARLQALQLGEECRAIEETIRTATYRDQIRFRSRWAARPDDLLQGLNEDLPSVLHFSGHGTADQGICFQSGDGEIVSVAADGLAQVIRAAGTNLKLVFLNSCYSDSQARVLAAHIPCVIGTPSAIDDRAAIAYAAAFYRALASARSIENAHQQGLAALTLKPLIGNLRDIDCADVSHAPPPAPTLLIRPDIDANHVYIVPPLGVLTVPAASSDIEVRRDGAAPRRRSTLMSIEGEPRFIGRSAELRVIGSALRDRSVVVLHGAPGIGKTRLALEYAHRHREAYPGGMFFASLERPPPTELGKLLRAMGKPIYANETTEEQCRRALGDLGGDGQALLIYDAVADEHALRSWMPYGGLEWHLIVTSTFADWASSWRTIEIAPLADQEALDLVSSILADATAAARLAGPIVSQAAGLAVELCAIAKVAYRQFLRSRVEQPPAGMLTTQTAASFDAAWRLLSRGAQLVLRIASAFPSSRASATRTRSVLQHVGWTSDAVDAAIDELCARSMARWSDQCVMVHPLVARYVQDREPLVDRRIQRSLRRQLAAAGDMIYQASADSDCPAVTDSPAVAESAAAVGTTRRRIARARRVVLWSACIGALAILGATSVLSMQSARMARGSAFVELTARAAEIRFAYPGASEHRPMREVTLGADSTDDPTQRITYDALSTLDKRGDKHGLAIAQAWNGEKIAHVLNQLRALPQNDPIRSDLAAIQVITMSKDNLQPVLAELEALKRSSDRVAARAARWNYALALTHLDLPLSAAAAFREIAGEHERGWAEEATQRADAEQQRAENFKATWQRAYDAGEALVRGGPPVDGTLVALRPGLLRAYLYDAVRTATSRARVLELAPMAAELDRVGDAQQHTLSDYVQHVATLNFENREPFARAFADLLAGKPIPEPMASQLTAETESEDIADIAMGAMVEREIVAAHRAWFRQQAERASDPWFEIVLASAAADAEMRGGHMAAAEALLLDGERKCGAAVIYQCVALQRRLARLYANLDRLRDALDRLQLALHTARTAGEWARYRALLASLADLERIPAATAMVRAYATEVVLMRDPSDKGDDCLGRGPTYRALAGASILDFDGRTARRHFMEALPCSEHTVNLAILLTDIGRLDPRPDDLPQLLRILGDARASGLNAADQILADETEGRLVIEHHRASGTVLLQQAIAAADKLPAEVTAKKARTGAYTALTLDAGRAGDHAHALLLISQELGLPLLSSCVVGIASEDERALVVVRGADGGVRGAYESGRGPSAAPLEVSAQLTAGLAGCPHVRVMALPGLQRHTHLLPPTMAWGYTVAGRGTARPTSEPPERTLIVTGAKPPEILRLAPVAIPPPEERPVIVLSDIDATPSRVIAAMPDATEIQFHVHALMDVDVSDASHLALSPDPSSGRYALTAEAIRKLELRGHPVVVLAACDSAQEARYHHQPWSLPDAFLAAGARAVFATATEIPDLESGRFFAAVLARVRSGVDPAAALRELRVDWLRDHPWVANVILFE